MRKKGVHHIYIKGVTLVELLAVIVILGILASISVVTIGKLFRNVREDVQIINMSTINDYIERQIELSGVSADALFTYKKSGSAGDEYFSIFLETAWEVKNGEGDADNTNVLNFTNSVSEKTGVVNWPDAPGIGDNLYCNQSLYITTDTKASYDVDSPTTINTCYAGAIIIWYNKTNADTIILYFVDNDGLQSDVYFIYEKENF